MHCTFDDFVGWAAPQIIFSVDCNSDPETLASFQYNSHPLLYNTALELELR